MSSSRSLNLFHQFGKKIIGIGMNYRNVAKELGAPIPNKPLVFLKPTTTYITEGQDIRFPPNCKEMLYEIEFGVVIGKRGFNISRSEADSYIGGYCVTLDMTSKDHWLEANKNGHPWALSKAFDTSTPIGRFIEKSKVSDPTNVQLWLNLNGKQRMNENTGDLIFPVDYLLEYITQYMSVEEGDLIITGTPPGFDTVHKGDVIEAGFKNIDSIKFHVCKN
ncbi:FAHD1 [Mytilus coruscus]|uniref:oxaloacetate tautomerase n=1 Tax=Mytilus coruscus TaxID=42192 RepID=A0A6J8ERP6_MYTCO|nr:FAHD1 [Mytilus coruscus]